MPALTITNLGSLAARIDTSAMAAVDLEIVSTAGTGGTRPRSGRLYYASSFRSLTPSGGFFTNQRELSRVASFFEFGFRAEDSGVRAFSQRVKVVGDFLYVWLEFDGQTIADPSTVVAINFRSAEVSPITQLSANALLQEIDNNTARIDGQVTAPQTTFSMVAVNDAVTLGVTESAELSLAVAVPNFISGGTFTVAFEKFTTSWVAATVIPKTLVTLSAGVTTATAVGLWRYRVESGVTQVRIRLTGLVTLTQVLGWVERFSDGSKIHLPYLGFTGGTFGQATNNPVVPAINWDRLGEACYDVQTMSGTSQVATGQETIDDSGTNWQSSLPISETTNTSFELATITAGGRYTFRPSAQYFRILFTYTAVTALTTNGIVATVVSGSSKMPTRLIVAGGNAAGATTGLSNPLSIAGQTLTAVLTTADSNNGLRLPVTTPGRQMVVRNGQMRVGVSQNNITLTSTTETSLLAAVASLFQDITEMTLTNTSASPTRVDIRTVTAGAVVLSINMVAGATVHLAWKTGLKQATVNTAWTAQCSAAVTDLRITAVADQWVG